MTKPILMAAGGVTAGAVVAAAVFFLVLSGGSEAAEEEEPREPVAVPGRLGPHIVLADRVFNLQGPANVPVYLKLQVLVEFETTDERWEHVLHGCVAAERDGHGAAMVSLAPGGAPPSSGPRAPAGDPCAAKERELLDEFEREIGTGRQLMEDLVTTIVTSYTAEEVTSPTGKEELRAEIRDSVNELLGGRHTVSRVLFLNFITQ